jgi:hypothetical protein
MNKTHGKNVAMMPTWSIVTNGLQTRILRCVPPLALVNDFLICLLWSLEITMHVILRCCGICTPVFRWVGCVNWKFFVKIRDLDHGWSTKHFLFYAINLLPLSLGNESFLFELNSFAKI